RVGGRGPWAHGAAARRTGSTRPAPPSSSRIACAPWHCASSAAGTGGRSPPWNSAEGPAGHGSSRTRWPSAPALAALRGRCPSAAARCGLLGLLVLAVRGCCPGPTHLGGDLTGIGRCGEPQGRGLLRSLEALDVERRGHRGGACILDAWQRRRSRGRLHLEIEQV